VPVENLDWAPVPSIKGILIKNTASRHTQVHASQRAESQSGFEIWAQRQQCCISMHLQTVCQFVTTQVQRFKRNLFKHRHNVFSDTSEYTWEAKMRTNVVIDDEWMESALKLSGLKFKKDAIEEGLKLLVLVKCQEAIRAYFSFSLSA
jgi:hypothetical protein